MKREFSEIETIMQNIKNTDISTPLACFSSSGNWWEKYDLEEQEALPPNFTINRVKRNQFDLPESVLSDF